MKILQPKWDVDVIVYVSFCCLDTFLFRFVRYVMEENADYAII